MASIDSSDEDEAFVEFGVEAVEEGQGTVCLTIPARMLHHVWSSTTLSTPLLFSRTLSRKRTVPAWSSVLAPNELHHSSLSATPTGTPATSSELPAQYPCRCGLLKISGRWLRSIISAARMLLASAIAPLAQRGRRYGIQVPYQPCSKTQTADAFALRTLADRQERRRSCECADDDEKEV